MTDHLLDEACLMSEAAKGGRIAPIMTYERRVPVEYRTDNFYPRAETRAQATTVVGMGGLLWRRRWVIAGAAFAALVLAVLIAKQLTPTYSADGAIVIASRKIAIPELETLTTPTGDDAAVRSEMAVLGSRNLLHQVAAQLQLDKVPEFNTSLRPKDTSLWAKINPLPWLQSLTAGKAPQQAPAAHDAVVNAQVENTLLKNLSLVNDGRSYIIQVAYRSEDPALAAKVVNTLMQDYLSQYMENNVSATVAANSSLQKRADELKSDLNTAEAKLQAFTAQTGMLETPQGTVDSTQVTDLGQQLAVARSDEAQAEAAYQEMRDTIRSGGSIASDPNVLSSPVIQELRQQEGQAARQRAELAATEGPRHPDVIAASHQLAGIREAIQTEVSKIVHSLRSQANSARARVASLQQRMDQLQTSGGKATEQQNMLQTLKDDVDGKRKLYDQFLLTVAQTAKPGDTPLVDARIISAAEAPIHPSSPRIAVIGLLAGVVGGLGAVAGVLSHSQLDSGFETLSDIEGTTGLPAFAAMPLVRSFGRRKLSDRYVLDNPNSPFTEALRALRARVWWAARERDVKSVLVTSAVPGEGKTSFALALARLAAKEGYKVLLLECDFRRPTLDRVLPITTVGGAPNFLNAPERWRDWIGIDPASGLHYLAAADDARNVAPLLESGRLDMVMREAREEYNLIVIDSPPIMRVPDAMLLARSVDVTMLMVRWRQTRRRVVLEALRRLYLDPDRLVGVVLSHVDARNAEQDIYGGYGS
jgi:succinoglycan biosynthesis transport protein ExoP